MFFDLQIPPRLFGPACGSPTCKVRRSGIQMRQARIESWTATLACFLTDNVLDRDWSSLLLRRYAWFQSRPGDCALTMSQEGCSWSGAFSCSLIVQCKLYGSSCQSL